LDVSVFDLHVSSFFLLGHLLVDSCFCGIFFIWSALRQFEPEFVTFSNSYNEAVKGLQGLMFLLRLYSLGVGHNSPQPRKVVLILWTSDKELGGHKSLDDLQPHRGRRFPVSLSLYPNEATLFNLSTGCSTRT